MIKNYKFNYDMFRGEAEFHVSTDMFTEVHAKETLEFFTWNYDKDVDPIDEVMKKYALEAIREATENNYSVKGVRDCFKNKEGFMNISGSLGIFLTRIGGLELEDDLLEMQVFNTYANNHTISKSQSQSQQINNENE